MICLFGFISGFTLVITGSTLNYWLAIDQIDIRTIGVFAIISIPYAINFIWAPILDTIYLGKLADIFGHRLSWLVVIHSLMIVLILLLSIVNPSHNLLVFGIIALFISFCSSTQDSILGGFKTEIINRSDQGRVSGFYVLGYRVGMLIASSGAIMLSNYIGFQKIYLLFALIVSFFPILLFYSFKSSKTKYFDTAVNNLVFSKFFRQIIAHIGLYKHVAVILIFLILYRLPDNFIGIMIQPFLLHLGYDSFDIAIVGKFFGIISAIIGSFIASLAMKRLSIYRGLLIFGSLHAIAHILFLFQEAHGKTLWLLCIVIASEGITGGMTMAVYIAFISSLCYGAFRATQYSFFSSMMGLSRSIFPSVSGYVVHNFGWYSFFLLMIVITIPALLLINYVRKILN
ncbi:MAG: MFS transporter [Rickettsiaceae bacterium]